MGMPLHALDVLAHCGDALPDQVLYLRGEALRALGRFAEAIVPLESAAEGRPNDIHVWLALGWCHKRTGRIDLAIAALDNALAAEPEDALIHYNLACYYSLAGDKREALRFLSRAVAMNGDFRQLMNEESDFDAMRSDPAFQALGTVVV